MNTDKSTIMMTTIVTDSYQDCSWEFFYKPLQYMMTEITNQITTDPIAA